MDRSQAFLLLRAAICWLAVLSISAPSPAADKDKAKLPFKVGDTVEVRDGVNWVRGTVVDLSFGDRVRVKTERFKNGWPFEANEIRPLVKKKPAAAIAKDDETNPFATPEEKAEQIGQRSWSDKSGKFRIEATILRIEGDKVVLKRTDDKEITVPIERLSPADQQVIAKAGGPAPKESGDEEPADPKSAKPAAKVAAESSIELTEADMSDANAVDISHTDNWSYQPDVLSKEQSLRVGRLALGQNLSVGERPKNLLIAPEKQHAFVVYRPSPFARKDGTQPGARIVACDLTKRKVLAAGEFHPEKLPLDVSSDGALLLARDALKPFGKGSVAVLFAMEGFKAKPKLSWQPYFDGKEAKEITWGAFVDDKHALTTSDKGLLVLWDLTDGVKAVYTANADYFGGTTVAFSANKKYLAFCERTGVVILEALTGQVAGHVLMSELGIRPTIAFRGDGKRMAVASGSRIRVWDFDKHEFYRDFVATGVAHGAGLAWADDDRLITSHGDLIDVERRIVLWKYTGVSDAMRFVGDCLWTVGDGQSLIGVRLPHEAARARAAAIKPDDLLVIKPGMEVSLEMQFVGTPEDQQIVQHALSKRLTDNGMNVVPQSNVRLIAQIKPGKAIPIAYRTFGSRAETQHTAMSQVMELSYVIDGQPVWVHTGESHPPHSLHLKKGQTIDQALSDHMRLDPKSLSGVYVPSHIPKTQTDMQSWTSPLPGA